MAIHGTLVHETSTTAGTGDLDLDGAIGAARSFLAAFGEVSDVTYFSRNQGGNGFEWGTCTIVAGTPNTLQRDTVTKSSNGDGLVDWPAGGKLDVYCDVPAEDIVLLLEAQTLTNKTLTDPVINGAYFGRNLIVAGDFRMAPWQEGTIFTAFDDVTHVADLHVAVHDATTKPDAIRDADGSLKITFKEINTQVASVAWIEGLVADDIAGGTISVRIRAKGSGIADIRIAVLKWTGAQDAQTRDLIATWATGATVPTWAASYTLQGSVVDLALTGAYAEAVIEGVSLDAGANNFAVVWWSKDADAAVNDTINVSHIQMNHGAKAAPLMRTDPPETLAGVTWLFERLNYNRTTSEAIGGGFGNTTSQGLVTLHYREKRDKPVITSSVASTFELVERATITPVNGISFSNQGVKSATLVADMSGTPIALGDGLQVRRGGTDTCFIDVDVRLGV